LGFSSAELLSKLDFAVWNDSIQAIADRGESVVKEYFLFTVTKLNSEMVPSSCEALERVEQLMIS